MHRAREPFEGEGRLPDEAWRRREHEQEHDLLFTIHYSPFPCW
jgi:hypothetical protein